MHPRSVLGGTLGNSTCKETSEKAGQTEKLNYDAVAAMISGDSIRNLEAGMAFQICSE